MYNEKIINELIENMKDNEEFKKRISYKNFILKLIKNEN